MKASMIFGLAVGAMAGAIVATMYKPARTAINKGANMAKQKVCEMAK